MATGNVYIFNLSGNNINILEINGVPANITAAGGTNPVSKANPLTNWGTTAPYQPNGLPVPRSPLPADTNPNPAFADRDPTNTVHVIWDTSSVHFDFSLSMMGRDQSLREDFLLYISTTQAILFDMYGTSLQTITNPKASSAISMALFAKKPLTAQATKKSSPAASKSQKSSKKSAK